MKTKVCSKCGKELPITSFSKQKDMKDGYRNDCKECVAKRSQKWREENYLRKRVASLNDASGRRSGKAGIIISNSEPIKLEDIIAMYNKNKTCYYCNKPLTKQDIVFDHKIPLSKGGSHTIDNICICCSDCNNLKGIRTDTEFYTFLQDYIQRFEYLGIRGEVIF